MQTATSPFIYGNIVSNAAFTNREEECNKLYNNLIQGINTIIISPRRWGKSSLVEKVIQDINKKSKKHKTLTIDLYSVSTEQEFLELFSREVIKASSSRWEDWVQNAKEFFKQLLPKIRFGIDPINDFHISFDWEELQQHTNELLNLPEVIAHKRKVKIIIALDEFQQIASFTHYDSLEKKMRAVWQRQKNVTYCIFGSKRHMMDEIFSKPSKPFYRFGDRMYLQKIATSKWIDFIVQNFAKTGKKIPSDIAQKIPKFMKDHPWYVQQFSHYIWNLTANKTSATERELHNALEELLYTNMPFYQKEVESLSKTQKNLLKAIVSGETQFTSERVMRKYHLGTSRNVSKNKNILTKKDYIHRVNGQFEFLDPAFELWFKKNFMNMGYSRLLQ